MRPEDIEYLDTNSRASDAGSSSWQQSHEPVEPARREEKKMGWGPWFRSFFSSANTAAAKKKKKGRRRRPTVLGSDSDRDSEAGDVKLAPRPDGSLGEAPLSLSPPLVLPVSTAAAPVVEPPVRRSRSALPGLLSSDDDGSSISTNSFNAAPFSAPLFIGSSRRGREPSVGQSSAAGGHSPFPVKPSHQLVPANAVAAPPLHHRRNPPPPGSSSLLSSSNPHPHSRPSSQHHSGGGASQLTVTRYWLDPHEDPLDVYNAPMMRMRSRGVAGGEEESLEATSADGRAVGDDGEEGDASGRVTLDLTSALRGYLEVYSECMIHLVEAALASRSEANGNLVGYGEFAEAKENPFLVRLMVLRGGLDMKDKQIQEAINRIVHSLIAASEDELSPTLYDYLRVFFELKCVSLEGREYTLLKRSGFEFITLMYTNQHVLPTSKLLYSIVLNNSPRMRWVNMIVMVVGFLINLIVSVLVIYEAALWVTSTTHVSYGFYACLSSACGYLCMLVFMIVLIRKTLLRSESTLPRSQQAPSLYLAVMPILPLYDVACIVKFFLLNQIADCDIMAYHNLFVISRIFGAFHCMVYGMPRAFLSSSVNEDNDSSNAIEETSDALVACVAIQFFFFILRILWMCISCESTTIFGFGAHAISKCRWGLAAHNAVAKTIFLALVFVGEACIYLMLLVLVNLFSGECRLLNLIVTSLSAATLLVGVVACIVLYHVRESYLLQLSSVCIIISAFSIANIVLISWKQEKSSTCYENSRDTQNKFVVGFMVLSMFLMLTLFWVFSLLFFMLREKLHVPVSSFVNSITVKIATNDGDGDEAQGEGQQGSRAVVGGGGNSDSDSSSSIFSDSVVHPATGRLQRRQV